jgi:hypothetical protein
LAVTARRNHGKLVNVMPVGAYGIAFGRRQRARLETLKRLAAMGLRGSYGGGCVVVVHAGVLGKSAPARQ